jgi:hypothetical protein
MADGVDAAVNAMELPSCDAIPNRPRAHTSRFELPSRYRTMLARGGSRDLGVGRVEFLTHVGT